jgi:hypothetical protein
MKTNTGWTNRGWAWFQTVAAGAFCIVVLPMAIALADLHASLAAAQSAAAVIQAEETPDQAQAQFDVGPGSDEALLATLLVSQWSIRP